MTQLQSYACCCFRHISNDSSVIYHFSFSQNLFPPPVESYIFVHNAHRFFSIWFS